MSYPIRKKPFPTLGFTSPNMTDKRVARSSGMHGVVTEAQNLLHGNGGGHFGSFHPGRVDGVYGAKSAHAARRAKYFLGYSRKRVNGHFGNELRSHLLPPQHKQHRRLSPLNRWRRLRRERLAAHGKYKVWFQPPATESLGEKMYKIAASQVGVKESPFGSNHVKYTEWYGFDGPWCAMFLSWVAHQAGSRMAKPLTRWASVAVVVDDAEHGRYGLHVVSNDSVRRGDWVPLHFTESFQHIEIFDHWIDKSRGIFATIGGNTGPISVSNGGEVARGARYIFNVHLFCRLEG